MKIRFIATLLSLLIALSVFAGCGGSGNSNIPDGGTDSGNTQQEQEEEENMTKTEKEYRSYFENDLKNFPINFVYGNTCYRGFDPKYFSLSEKSEQKSEQKEETVYIFNLDNVLQVRLETAFYREYNAYEWTVYFSNISSNENSAQLKYVNAVDMEFEGANPHLRVF